MNWIENHLLVIVIVTVVCATAGIMMTVVGKAMLKKEDRPWTTLLVALLGFLLSLVGGLGGFMTAILSIVLKIITHVKA